MKRSRIARLLVALMMAGGVVLVAPDVVAAPTSLPIPDILPAPQSVIPRGVPLPVPPVVSLMVGQRSDAAAVAETEAVLRDAGVLWIRRGEPAPLTVWIGGPTENPASAEALRRLGVAGPQGLPAEGYVLASRPGELVLSGVDAEGTYYATQTLRRLLVRSGPVTSLPNLEIRDWPAMSWRGIVEGFYGQPWTTQDQLRQLDLAATNKMNVFVYGPKDDPYDSQRWREPYPPDKLAELGQVVQRARSRHVDFVFAVSPGLDICYTSPSDLAALASKANSLWEKGVRDFAVFFDDIGDGLHCAQDHARFDNDPSPLAAAQAYLLAEFHRVFLAERPDVGRLITVPTEYNGTDGSGYKQRFGDLVAAPVLILWTGPKVLSPTVTETDAAKAHAVFRHDLLLWDNFPVNDFEPRSLFLGPLAGRAGTLPVGGIVGLTANPMPQAEPSGIALTTAADYAWNPAAYSPARSWELALRLVGGEAVNALRLFADAAYDSMLDPTGAPTLAKQIAAFWAERDQGGAGPATAALTERFAMTARAPAELQARMKNPAFVAEAESWLTKLHWYGVAGQAATAGLAAELRGDGTEGWRQRVIAARATSAAQTVYPRLAADVMRPFLERAHQASQVVTLQATAAGATALTLSASVRAGSTAVTRVEFYAGDKLVGQADRAPYRLDWHDVPAALHVLTARAVAANGDVVDSAPVRLTVGAPLPALLVVGESTGDHPSTAGDVAVVDRLELLGHPVVVKPARETTSADANGKALIVVSSTVASGDVGTKFREVAVPLLTWESFVLDDLAMAGEVGETWRVDRIRIADEGSPLAAGLSGDQTVYGGPNRLRWGVPAAGATRGANMPDDPRHAALFGYPTGAPMVGLTAPAPRVGVFLSDEGLDPDVVTAETLRLFDAAVRWAVQPTAK